MPYELSFTEQAAYDLDEIIKYIKEELNNPHAASNFFQMVHEKNELLREHPYMHPLYSEVNLHSEGYRSVVIGNYLLFYIVNVDQSLVSISRILYGKRNISAIFE